MQNFSDAANALRGLSASAYAVYIKPGIETVTANSPHIHGREGRRPEGTV